MLHDGSKREKKGSEATNLKIRVVSEESEPAVPLGQGAFLGPWFWRRLRQYNSRNADDSPLLGRGVGAACSRNAFRHPLPIGQEG